MKQREKDEEKREIEKVDEKKGQKVKTILVSLFTGISTFMDYLMPMPSL